MRRGLGFSYLAQVETDSSDTEGMLVSYVMSLASLFLFCGCCYALIKSVTTRIPLFNRDMGYSKAALRVARGYKVTAWSIMTVFFLISLINSFVQVFNDI